MAKALKIKKEYGDKARTFLRNKNWLDTSRIVGKTAQRYLLLPLTGKFKEKELLKKFPDAQIVTRSLQKLPARTGNLKNMLKGVVPEKHIDKIINSFDTIGDIAILNIPKNLQKLEKSIAWALKRAQPQIKVVAKKTSIIKGKYRKRELKILVGEKRTTTFCTEAGVNMNMDLSKVFFTPRLSKERLRIANLVKPKENIAVLFAGIGPFALVIAKKKPNAKIWAVELNPDAYKYLEENIRINRITNITPIKGNVKKVLPAMKEKFNRIIAVLPKTAFDFLDIILKAASKNTIVHFYVIMHENDVKTKTQKIITAGKKLKKKIKILRKIKAGKYGPHIWRWCIDFQVS